MYDYGMTKHGLGQYITAFEDNDIDGEILASGLTDDDLKSIGISSLGARKKILTALDAEFGQSKNTVGGFGGNKNMYRQFTHEDHLGGYDNVSQTSTKGNYVLWIANFGVWLVFSSTFSHFLEILCAGANCLIMALAFQRNMKLLAFVAFVEVLWMGSWGLGLFG
jgi:hypothetical protein